MLRRLDRTARTATTHTNGASGGQGLRPYDPDPASGGQGYLPWTSALREARRPLTDGAPEATRPRPPGPGRSSSRALQPGPGGRGPVGGDLRHREASTQQEPQPPSPLWERTGRRSCDFAPRSATADRRPPTAQAAQIHDRQRPPDRLTLLGVKGSWVQIPPSRRR